MAIRGVGYFDERGQYFRAPDEATISDLAALLGRVGEGDSLAPGIAKIILDRRREIEHIFADHDAMTLGMVQAELSSRRPVLVAGSEATVTRLQGSKPA